MYKKFIILFLISFVFFSCSEDDGIVSYEHPDGWTAATHGKYADANYTTVFPQASVERVDITISAANWSTMYDDMTSIYGTFGGESLPPGPGKAATSKEDVTFPDQDPVWVPCTFEFGTNTWWYVGIRFKGNSSLMTSWMNGKLKLPFRLDFDQFEDTYPAIDDQRFYGFKKLTLSSGYNDDSLMREKVAADIFRAAGVPAPQTAFYRVYINYGEGSTYFGLYTMVEVPEDPMLTAQFGYNDGNLYKPDVIRRHLREHLLKLILIKKTMTMKMTRIGVMSRACSQHLMPIEVLPTHGVMDWRLCLMLMGFSSG